MGGFDLNNVFLYVAVEGSDVLWSEQLRRAAIPVHYKQARLLGVVDHCLGFHTVCDLRVRVWVGVWMRVWVGVCCGSGCRFGARH